MNDTEKLYKDFPITSVCRADLEGEGFDTSNVDDGDMKYLAAEMADAYCNFAFWADMKILAEQQGIKRKRKINSMNVANGEILKLKKDDEKPK